MKEYFLLEDVDASIRLNPDSVVISADPQASSKLLDGRVSYSIIEDYYDEKSLWFNDKLFYDAQLEWFLKFDRFFLSQIKFCKEHGVQLATLNYLRIKYFVDMVIIYSKILSSFVRKIPSDSKLTYVHRCPETTAASIFDFSVQNRVLFKAILEVFCSQNNVRLVCAGLPRTATALGKVSRISEGDFTGHILRSLKNFLCFKKYQKMIFLGNRRLIGKRLCFLHAGSADIDVPIERFIRCGGEAYIQAKGAIFLEGLFCSKPVFIINQSVLPEIASDTTRAAAFFERDNEIVRWISEQCGFNVYSICAPYFKNFISKELGEVLSSAASQVGFLNDFQIDSVVVRGNTDRQAISALIAAQCAKRTKRVCVQHAGLAIKKSIFPVFETCSYDYLWTRDELSQRYFEREQKESYPSSCVITQSAHVAQKNVRKSRNENIFNEGGKQHIIYLETRFPGHLRAFGNPSYSPTEYYEFQRRMIDLMATRTDVHWIFKHAPRRDYQSPIIPYIRNTKASNISVINRPFIQCVHSVDKVFMDYFSTAFYESLLARKQTLCLAIDYFDWIPEMKQALGESLNSFHTFDDAKKHLLKFVEEPVSSARYRTEIPYKKQSTEDFLSHFLSCYEMLSKPKLFNGGRKS